MHKFSNTRLRETKRQLSAHEKTALPTTSGRALLLPGSIKGEVEELIDAGYDPAHIFGVEKEPGIYSELFDFYRDTVHIVNEDVFTWMRNSKARGTYSYIHLDMCGHLAQRDFYYYQHWSKLPAENARVRVSLFRGRRSAAQFDWESRLYDELLLQWCRIGHERDVNDPARWEAYYNHFQEHINDSTRIMVGLMIMNFFFGIEDYRTFLQTCSEQGEWYIPHVLGDHDITNIKRYTYNEAGSPNYMFTVWADLVPLTNPLRTSEQWALNGIDKIFQQMDFTVPPFNPNL